jgi:hypothetical protein
MLAARRHPALAHRFHRDVDRLGLDRPHRLRVSDESGVSYPEQPKLAEMAAIGGRVVFQRTGKSQLTAPNILFQSQEMFGSLMNLNFWRRLTLFLFLADFVKNSS